MISHPDLKFNTVAHANIYSSSFRHGKTSRHSQKGKEKKGKKGATAVTKRIPSKDFTFYQVYKP
jgi:hypothetical protein